MKLHEDDVKSGFSSYINKHSESSQNNAFVGGYWNVLKESLQEAADRSFA